MGSLHFRLTALLAATLHNATALAADEPEADEPKSPRGSVSFDPTGVALWGTSFSAEVDLGPVSLTATHRWLGSGLMLQIIHSGNHELVEPLYSHALGVRANYYALGGLSGFHVGAGVDYALLVLEVEDYANYGGANYLVPGLHLGYRFRLGPVFLDPSASFHQAFFIGQSTFRRGSISDPEDLLRGGRAYISDAHQTGGDLHLEFGFYL